MDFIIDIDDLNTKLEDRGWERIGLQFPEGLKPFAGKVIRALREGLGDENIEFIVSGSSCYGACDVSDKEFLKVEADGMIHFGHAEIPAIRGNYHIPVIFIEMQADVDATMVVKKALDSGLLKGVIGLTTTVQFVHELPDMQNLLERRGKDVRIGIGTDRLAHPGQVLGCSFSSALAVPDTDVHLFVGEGLFHPLGIALATGKPVIAADPRSRELKDLEEEKNKVLKQRFGVIQKLKDSGDIGVVLSTLPGQKRMELATSLLRKGRDKGKNMNLITASHLNPMSLRNIGAEVFVSTACPRVAIDDYSLFLEHGIVMATPIEFLIAIGEMKWENYVLDTID